MPPIMPHNKIKKKFIRDMAKARSLLTPALPKKYMVETSLSPRPPMEIGSNVKAPIIGRKTKK